MKKIKNNKNQITNNKKQQKQKANNKDKDKEQRTTRKNQKTATRLAGSRRLASLSTGARPRQRGAHRAQIFPAGQVVCRMCHRNYSVSGSIEIPAA